MIFHSYYADVTREEVDRFVRSQEMGRLVTVAGDGTPHIGLYPFAYDDGAIEVHLVRRDEQTMDLRQRATCLFEVDEILGVIPSYWVHAENAVMATAYHRTVIFECRAAIVEDGALLAAQQTRLLARYQPEGGFRPVDPEHPFYREAIAHIAAVRLEITACRVKFKLGQNRPPDVRAKIVDELRKRGRPGDMRAADGLASTMTQEDRA